MRDNGKGTGRESSTKKRSKTNLSHDSDYNTGEVRISKDSEMPSRISGNAGAETNTMVDDFCNDLYAFLGESAPSTPANKNVKRKSKKWSYYLI